MPSNRGFEVAAWLGLGYLSAVLQTAFDAKSAGPHWMLAVAAGWLTMHPGPRGVLGVAAIGLVLDAVGNGRLGLHLAICGALAAAAILVLGPMSRWWHRPLVAAGLAFGDAMLFESLASLSLSTRPDLLGLLRTSAATAAWTAGLLAAATLMTTVGLRLLDCGPATSALRLNNRWNRLTNA
uniref:Rod shape-determining protein MreD n=1 Tax=Schlesneria paludicola TaxID=360056 RepID=A0A7C2NTK7_9PLAN